MCRPAQNLIEVEFEDRSFASVPADSVMAAVVPLPILEHFQTLFDTLTGGEPSRPTAATPVDDPYCSCKLTPCFGRPAARADESNELLVGAVFDIVDDNGNGATTREEIIAFLQRVVKFAADTAITVLISAEGLLQTAVHSVVKLPMSVIDDLVFTNGQFTATSLLRLLKVPVSLAAQTMLQHHPLPAMILKQILLGEEGGAGESRPTAAIHVEDRYCSCRLRRVAGEKEGEFDDLFAELRQCAADAIDRFNIGAESELLVTQVGRTRVNSSQLQQGVIRRDCSCKPWLTGRVLVAPQMFRMLLVESCKTFDGGESRTAVRSAEEASSPRTSPAFDSTAQAGGRKAAVSHAAHSCNNPNG